MDVFEAWSNRFLSVCELHLRARIGGMRAEQAEESLSTNHWLMPMLFSEVERHGAAYGRETGRALHAVKSAKAAVSPFLGPTSRSDGSAQPFDKAVAELRAACEEFRAALAADIARTCWRRRSPAHSTEDTPELPSRISTNRLRLCGIAATSCGPFSPTQRPLSLLDDAISRHIRHKTLRVVHRLLGLCSEVRASFPRVSERAAEALSKRAAEGLLIWKTSRVGVSRNSLSRPPRIDKPADRFRNFSVRPKNELDANGGNARCNVSFDADGDSVAARFAAMLGLQLDEMVKAVAEIRAYLADLRAAL
jgi:hypothetical protein